MINKINNIHLNCDTCGICVGPNYLSKEFVDIGSDKLCKLCYTELMKKGFLYLKTKEAIAEIFLPSGAREFLDKTELQKLFEEN